MSVANIYREYLMRLFEAEFADWLGVRNALGFNNGTAALHICALALNVQPGQRVITTPLTFSTSLTAALTVRTQCWHVMPATA